MTNFDELIGEEPAGAERDRLRSVHELLVEAGPPPELTPEVASGPTLAMTLGRVRRMTRSRRMLIPAVAAALLIALVIGGSLGGGGGGGVAIPLEGTVAAPLAHGTLTVLTAEPHTQPVQITVEGLEQGHYVVYLVRNGRPWTECGSFTVRNPAADTVAKMNSPYSLQAHDTWVVTRQVTGGGRGATVLRPRPSTD